MAKRNSIKRTNDMLERMEKYGAKIEWSEYEGNFTLTRNTDGAVIVFRPFWEEAQRGIGIYGWYPNIRWYEIYEDMEALDNGTPDQKGGYIHEGDTFLKKWVKA